MKLAKFATVGIATSLLLASTAQAASTRASAMPVAPVAAKKLVRSSAPVDSQAKGTGTAIVLGILGAGAVGAGTYFAVRDASAGS
ncbi:MAG TPA: hypothetical protein EYH41_05225 [Novosphingobium capsulatum]|nr:hypothetical protein [Novosphingobium capsulatum]